MPRCMVDWWAVTASPVGVAVDTVRVVESVLPWNVPVMVVRARGQPRGAAGGGT